MLLAGREPSLRTTALTPYFSNFNEHTNHQESCSIPRVDSELWPQFRISNKLLGDGHAFGLKHS